MTRPSDVTDREMELLSLISTGASNKEIAALMGLTELTTRTYASWVFRKLGVDNRVSAALWYLSFTGRLIDLAEASPLSIR